MLVLAAREEVSRIYLEKLSLVPPKSIVSHLGSSELKPSRLGFALKPCLHVAFIHGRTTGPWPAVSDSYVSKRTCEGMC